MQKHDQPCLTLNSDSQQFYQYNNTTNHVSP